MSQSKQITINKINITNPLTPEIIKALKESFVKVYGESYRERIESAIDNIDFYFLPTMKLEKSNISSVAGTIEEVFHREFGNPDITDKIPRVEIEKMLDAIYINPENYSNHRTILEEQQNYRLNAIVKFTLGDSYLATNEYGMSFIADPKIKEVAKLFDRFLVVNNNLNGNIQFNEKLLREFQAYTDRETLQVFLQSMNINFDFEFWPKNGEFAPISEYDLQMANTFLPTILNKTCMIYGKETKLYERLHKIDQEIYSRLEKIDPFIQNAYNDIISKYNINFQPALLQSLQNIVYNNQNNTAAFCQAVLDHSGNPRSLIISPDATHLSTDCLIHEINHAIETTYLGNNCFKGGFQQSNREFWLNEIVNEHIAQKVTKHYNTFLSNNSQLRVGFNNNFYSGYSVGLPIFSGFIEQNWETILKCRNSNLNLDAFIGKEDMDELCRIADSFFTTPSNQPMSSETFEHNYNTIQRINAKLKLASQQTSQPSSQPQQINDEDALY